MTRNHILFILILLLNCFFSCKKANRDPSYYQEYGFPSISKVTNQSLDKKSDTKSQILEFVSNEGNTIRAKEEITVNGTKCLTVLNESLESEGKYLCFYEDNTLSVEGRFTKGKRDSIWVYYYENGSKKIVQNFFNDKVVGNYWEYDEAGRCKKHCLLNFDAQCEYLLKFDSSENILSEDGVPWLIFFENRKDQFSINDTIIGNIFISAYREDYHLFAEAQEGAKVIITPLAGREGLFFIQIHFSKKGTHDLRIFLQGIKADGDTIRLFQPARFKVN